MKMLYWWEKTSSLQGRQSKNFAKGRKNLVLAGSKPKQLPSSLAALSEWVAWNL
jgi:negative regulator of replication initiation